MLGESDRLAMLPQNCVEQGLIYLPDPGKSSLQLRNPSIDAKDDNQNKGQ